MLRMASLIKLGAGSSSEADDLAEDGWSETVAAADLSVLIVLNGWVHISA